ncbi:aldehyde dehydrogenase family protein [Alicyclobacillus mengziensis]|uniref:3-sulfolactaldehyde dehydrogenase n=2 Tax=Alicyclobacillus mengziensis TaxID=2931921 RepID=A0A9X7Z5W1_9BACL|nr:aldehyde dehydrogenase family protein [Alicyclobacillus mengziensis]QSO47299.1 aldehyde dehydrogenase family protein [Alicyclobacillus mengziensis]
MMSLWIDGEWIDTEEKVPVLNKYTGEIIAHVSQATREHVRKAVEGAQRAMQEHPLSVQERYRILSYISNQLELQADRLAMTIAKEAGKPFSESRTEVLRAVQTFRISAEEAKRISGEMVPLSSPHAQGKLAFTLRVPIGVVCAISPFNFPLNLVAHKVAPAIAAGNAFVLKPATYTPLTAISLMKLFEEAGLPKGYGNLVIGSGRTVGQYLLEEPGFAYYTFTGSPPVGKHLREAVGLRKTTLELGSNSAIVVHQDADLDLAADRCAKTAFNNAGQVCISVQRIYVQEEVYDAFLGKFKPAVEALKVGDPSDPSTQVGPMISETEAMRAEAWIQEAVEAGATLITGGTRDGAVVSPTVLTNTAPTCRVCSEEAFAPLVVVNRYQTLDEAIMHVNDSRFGLQAGIFTSSIDVMLKFSKRVQVGGVNINDTSAFRADEMPYGGVKESGVGREGPRYAIEEMTESRLVVIHN